MRLQTWSADNNAFHCLGLDNRCARAKRARGKCAQTGRANPAREQLRVKPPPTSRFRALDGPGQPANVIKTATHGEFTTEWR